MHLRNILAMTTMYLGLIGSSHGSYLNSQDFYSSDTLKKNGTKFINSIHGNITLGYDYGYLPFIANIDIPNGYFKSEGNISFNVNNLPFSTSFFYTTLRNISGLNNYFRISFDLQSYKNSLSQIGKSRIPGYAQQIASLKKKKQELHQKILYLNQVKSGADSYLDKLNFPSYSHPNISLDSFNRSVPDSISISQNFQTPTFEDSNYLYQQQRYKDSINSELLKIKNQSDSLIQKIELLESLIDQIQNPNQLSKIPVDSLNPLSKMEKIICGFNKFEIGLCYPNYSTFLVNNIPIKGINLEYEYGKYFYAFTFGTSINNLLFTNNIIQNNLQNTQNLFNFFDFNNLQQGRRIVSAKTGIGQKENDHFFVGILYAKGQQSYYIDTIQNLNNATKEQNLVLELDTKLNVAKWLTLTSVYGKSSLQPINETSDSTLNSISQLFSPFRSNAFLSKAELSFSKLKTNLTATFRLIDPFFRSYGIGFIRSDNIRYEIKSNHQLGKKVKMGLYWRRDQNNLLNLFNYSTVLQSGGINFQYRVNKGLIIRANFNPVFQSSFNESELTSYTNQNYISTILFNHQTRFEKVNLVTNLSASYYRLLNGVTNTDYINITAINTINFKGFANNISASYFDVSGMDSLSGSTLLFVEELSLKIRKVNLSLGIKFCDNHLQGNQFGYSVKFLSKISKSVGVEVKGEKLVLGDFYNSIGLEQFEEYPYFWSGKIIINW